jgi:hypothetical protein
METQYTAAPWHSKLDGHFRGWTYVVNEQRDGVAMVTEGEHTLANARLIAAAPDLLDALKAFVRIADVGRGTYRAQIEAEVLGRAEAAIRKAEQGE